MSGHGQTAFRLGALSLLAATVIVAGARCYEEAPQRTFEPRHPAVQVLEDRPGAGPEAIEGRIVEAHYIARLPDGKEILNTRAKGQTDTWRLGDGAVIAGIDDAVRGMRPGGRRTVVIPPWLHWGSNGYGGVVPPNTKLTFEIEVIAVN